MPKAFSYTTHMKDLFLETRCVTTLYARVACSIVSCRRIISKTDAIHPRSMSYLFLTKRKPQEEFMKGIHCPFYVPLKFSFL